LLHWETSNVSCFKVKKGRKEEKERERDVGNNNMRDEEKDVCRTRNRQIYGSNNGGIGRNVR